MRVLINPYSLGDANRLLWLRAENTLASTTVVDSSIYARTVTATNGVVSTTQTKCGNSVFGGTSGVRIDYPAATLPPFEDQPFVIQTHWYWHGGGGTEPVLFARMVQGEGSTFGLGWRLRLSVGTGFIFQSLAGTSSVHSRSWSASTSSGVWRHVALKWDGTELKLWLNDVELSPLSTSGTAQVRLEAGAEFHIGHGRNTGSQPNNGFFDEFTIDRGNRAISSACPI